MARIHETFKKLKETIDRNKAAATLLVLFFLGGMAALTHLPGARAPRERKLKTTAGTPFQGRVERWKAPAMERSSPEAMVKAGDALGKREEPGQESSAEAAEVETQARRAGKRSDSEDETEAPSGVELPTAASARRQKMKAFDNSSSASGSGGGAQSSPAEGGSGSAGSGAVGGLSAGGSGGPFATLKRNLSILGKKAGPVLGIGAPGSGGSRPGFASGSSGAFSAVSAAQTADGGRPLTVTGALAPGSVALARAPGGGPGRGGGGGANAGGGGSGGGGGDSDGTTAGTEGSTEGTTSGHTSGHTSGTTSGETPAKCEQRCKDKCAKAGHPGGNCVKDCIRHEHCGGGKTGGHEEECLAPPDHFEAVPNMIDQVRMAAEAHPDWIKVACVDGHKDQHKFLDSMVSSLRAGNKRWGYVCKRGNCNNLSQDRIGYYAGPNPKNGGRDVIAPDIILACGPPSDGRSKNLPQWIESDCFNPKYNARWTDGRRRL